MKTKLFFLAMVTWSFSMLGQSEKIGQLFKLKVASSAVYVKKILGKSVNPIAAGTIIMVEENVMFVVQNITSTDVFFYAKNYTPLHPLDPRYHTLEDKSYCYNDLLFSMSIATYRSNAADSEFQDRITLGLLTLPYKLRPQKNTSFDSEFNLNATLGVLVYGRLFGNSKIYLQGGAGLSSVSLNTTNAPGLNADQAQNVSCLTGFGGVMLQYKDVQTGFYLGGDWIKNNAKYNWESQGNIWISFGIGFKIFTLAKKDINK